MKHVDFWLLLAPILAVALTACPSKDKNDSTPDAPKNVATTPLDNSCISGQVNCNTGAYQNYQPYGFQPYPQGNPYMYGGGGYWSFWVSFAQSNGYNVGAYNSALFCQCPWGSRPVYNNQFGLGCVANTAIQTGWSVGGYSLPAANNQWTNMPQVSSVQNNPIPNSQNCYSNVVQSCVLGQQSCAGGQVCRPTYQNQSGMGICSY